MIRWIVFATSMRSQMPLVSFEIIAILLETYQQITLTLNRTQARGLLLTLPIDFVLSMHPRVLRKWTGTYTSIVFH